MPSNLITITCQECGFSFETEQRNRFQQHTCDTCEEKKVVNAETDQRLLIEARRRQEFLLAVPPRYRDTDTERLRRESPKIMSVVDSYTYSDIGVGMAGRSGKGKTRAAVLILKKAQTEGKTICYLPAAGFSSHAGNQWNSDSKKRADSLRVIEKAHHVGILLLDDLGKARTTPTGEEALFSLLEYRHSHMLPTIWTSNSNAEQLAQMFCEDKTEAIMRRLTEFTKVITDFE
jgi:DNA replication protein DnaC